MNLTRISLRQTRVLLTALCGVAIMGYAAYEQLPRDDMPAYTVRTASVVTRFPGAGPERIEALVTKPLEQAAQELPEVDAITSDSRTGVSVIKVELRQDVPPEKLRAVWDHLRRKVDGARGSLPEGTTPEVKDDDIGVVYGIVLGLQSDGFSPDELRHYAEELRDRILTLDDAARVDLGGLQDPQIYVDYAPERLAELGLTSSGLQDTLASTNIIYPGGSVVLGNERIILEPTGNLDSVQALADTLIPLPSGGTVTLGRITEISRANVTPPQAMVRVNGRPGVTLSVALREGGNLTRMGQELDALVTETTQDLPIGLEVTRVASQDHVVEQSIDDFVANLLQAVASVLAVMLLMLGLRIGAVVASLIPMTMLAVLMLLGVVGEGLNQVTLAGLIMALGMLVDNAIVVSEAVLVEMGKGRTADEAAVGASEELAIPLLVSSLTTSAAFLAFYLAKSTMGDIVGSLFVVITLSLLASWVLSLTMIPLLLKWFARPPKSDGDGRFFGGLRALYAPTVRLALRRRWWVLIATPLLFVGTMATARHLPFIFFPDSDRALVAVEIELPLGARIEATDEAVARIEEHVRQTLGEDVRDLTAFVGEGPASYDLGYRRAEPNASYAHLLVNTMQGAAIQRVIDAINAFGRDALPDADVRAGRLAGGGGGVPIEVRISGHSPVELMTIAERTKRALLGIPGARNVRDDWGPRIKKFVVDLDEGRLRAAGLTHQDVAVSLQTVLTGFQTGDFRESDDLVPITMRADDATRYRIEDVRNTMVHPLRGGPGVPLSQVGEVRVGWQYPRVRHRNLVRQIAVTAWLEPGFTAPEVLSPLTAFLEEDRRAWPPGYAYALGGDSERSQEGMQSVIDELPLAAAIILLLLVAQFNSFRKTTIVAATIPLGLIGVVLGLHAFRSYFGFFAFIGAISLAGIIINNAIVLLDRIRIEIEENAGEAWDAIIAASHHRLRPIVLTTLTTTIGLVPLYLGGGAMWEPMAVSLMVGLLCGTVITLVFVPALYAALYRVAPPGDAAAPTAAADRAAEAPAEA